MSNDRYNIDSHKLIYHVKRVHDWLDGENIYPIYMEISPAGMCNHRCVFCALDFMGYERRFLDTNTLKKRLSELGTLGLKSVMFAGEGEPLLHKDIIEIITHTKKSGIDASLTTNGVLLKKSVAEKILSSMEWIKVSINAGTADTYSKIHRTKPADFKAVIKNMEMAVNIKEAYGHSCTLGMQMLLLPENKDEAITLSRIARDIGLDYLVIKPYSQHLLSTTDRYKNFKYNTLLHLEEELKTFNTDTFNVIFRIRAMQKWDSQEKKYSKCFALPFWSYLDAQGNVWGCSMFLGDERFLYGNIMENSFQEIWEGRKRKTSLEMIEREFDPSKCRINCRMDEINNYLWNLKHLPEHVNFI